ncbi:MAG: universal stress protein [Haloarculaceae archaeon]
MYTDILVPTDGSEASLRAAREAIDLARAIDATVHVVYVVDESAGTMLLSGSSMATLLEELNERGAEATEAVSALADDVPVETEVVRGTRVEGAILDYATAHDVDLIVMGSHGKRGIDRLLGSTTQRVLAHSDIPVLVVASHEAEDEPGGEPSDTEA